MLISTSLFFLILTTIVQCQNISVQFPSFQADIDVGSCTCDLTAGQCDISCCCDPDCSQNDLQAFDCSSRDNQYTNSTPIVSSVQPTCVKNLSIFHSDSPYIIQKMGELVCVDYQRYQGSQYYQKPTVQTLNANDFLQAIDAQYGVSAPYSPPTNQTRYQVGTPILVNTPNGNGTLYSLPVSLFNSPLCAGSQSITYMNNFTSTCSQIVSISTCTGALNPVTYNSTSIIQPSGNVVPIVSLNTTVTASIPSGTTCTGALQSIIVTIYYQNPTGIINANFIYGTTNTVSPLFSQTFTVNFVKTGTLSSNGTSNPGYLQGANILIGSANGSMISTRDSSLYSILQPLSSGYCNTASTSTDRIPIVFGQSVRSTCRYNAALPSTTLSILTPLGLTNISIGAYSNSDPSNATQDWLPIIVCRSQIGSPVTYTCRDFDINTDSTSCYARLDIQIAYTNVGSIFNPQHVLSAVIYHYQYLMTCPTNLLLTGSVTFQDLSNAPIVAQGQIPTPNTQLPANFFYPFSVSQGTTSMTCSLFVYFLIAVRFILI